MASSAKVSKAYKAMKALGYTSQIVKPVLKNLLVAYDQNWQHIEDENYAVLVDAILESEERKEKERKKFRLIDEPEEDEEPFKKRPRMRSHMVEAASSPGNSSPSSNGTTNKLQHDVENIMSESNGKEKMTKSAHGCLFDIETEAKVLSPLQHYQREAETSTSNSSSGSKLTKTNQVLSHEKSNESDPLLPRTQQNDNGETYTSCSIVQRKINKRSPHAFSWEEKNVIHNSFLCNQKKVLNKNYSDGAGEIELLPDDLFEFDVPLAIVPPGHPRLLIEDDSSSAKEKFSTSPQVIAIDIEDTSALALCCEDDSSNGKDSLRQGNCLEYECSVATNEENSSSNSSQIVIASSSKGEVKLSITYESSLRPKFYAPSLDAVLRRMEEKLLKSYRIPEPGFSVMKLMKDICEGFLEVGTIVTDDKGVRCADVDSNPTAPKEIDIQDVLNRNDNHQVGFCVAPNITIKPVQLQSLIEVRSQIQKFQILNYLDCKIDLTMKGFNSEKNKNILPLEDLKSSTSSNMVNIQKQHFPHRILNSGHYIADITRGEEDLQISLINEFNDELEPMFKYIPRNIAYQSAYVKFLLARISDENCCSNCFGDCLAPEIPCACAGETGGEYAYMPGGLLKEKFLEDCISMNHSPQQKNLFYCQECPLERSKGKKASGACKGHLVRKFIKECWYKCGCNKYCGNRVVQRGITHRVQVFMTLGGKGWGLRTLEDLPKGAFICEYVGEVVTNMELYERNTQNTGKKHTYPVLLDADWCTEGVLKDEEALCLDATFYGNVARFVNHRCYDANLVEIPVEVETPDHHYYHLAFFTRRKVDALEELTWDYGIDFNDHTHPVKAFQCCCGSQFCRDMKTMESGNGSRE